MQAGKLNRQVTIASASPAQDAFGEPAQTWTEVFSCWAHLAALTGREVYALGAGFSSQVTHKVTIRYTLQPIVSGMRVMYGSRVLLVQAVQNPDEANLQLELLCLEQM